MGWVFIGSVVGVKIAHSYLLLCVFIVGGWMVWAGIFIGCFDCLVVHLFVDVCVFD